MLGLITEYNPFHNGHLLHINKSKEKTNSKNCIVVMSGNFVQRGEPAIFDKFLRTKMALLNGADVVLELPLHFSTSSAETFALGAIDLLDKTGVVKHLCFGTETGEISSLLNIAEILSKEPKNFKIELSNQLKKGLSFPKARFNALSNTLNENIEFLNLPNNILAIEYLKALIKLKSNIKPYTIKRELASFHSKNISGNIASATALRLALKENNLDSIKKCIPLNCYELIESNFPYTIPSLNDYSIILNYILKTTSRENLRNICEISEGFENILLKNSNKTCISDLISSVKSKRYTYTKIQRTILNIILEKTKEEDIFMKKNLNQYIRILGFKKSSSNIISEMSKKATVPIITNLKNTKNILPKNTLNILEKNIKATDIYYINKNKPINYEFSNPIIII